MEKTRNVKLVDGTFDLNIDSGKENEKPNNVICR